MAFTNSNSVVASDLNNMVRGLYRDNTTHTVTGTTAETDMASLSIDGGTIGATGALHVIAAGTITNTASAAKVVRLYLGATALVTINRTGANAQEWLIDGWCFNMSAATQRWTIIKATDDATTLTLDFGSSTIDTASAATLKLTGDLVDATDAITQYVFDVFIVQIT